VTVVTVNHREAIDAAGTLSIILRRTAEVVRRTAHHLGYNDLVMSG